MLLSVVKFSLAPQSQAYAASLPDPSVPTLVSLETTATAAVDVDALPDCAAIPLTNSTELQSYNCKVPVDVATELQASAGLAARQNNGCLLVAPDSNDGRQLCVNSGLPGSVSLNAASPTSCICTVWTRVRAVGTRLDEPGHDDVDADMKLATCRRLRRLRRATAMHAGE